VANLLFVDFDGKPANPDDVISESLDGGYRGRSEELADVLYDSDEAPFSRFLACLALTRWADGAGYDAEVEVAGRPESSGAGGVRRGGLAARRPQRCDLATQLVDLAAAVATVDAATAVSLAQDVLCHDAGHRLLVYAVPIVQRAKTPETRRFADYLSMVGDDGVRPQMKQPIPYEALVHEAALRIRVGGRVASRSHLARILDLSEAESGPALMGARGDWQICSTPARGNPRSCDRAGGTDLPITG
jgi:hypothetical protein